jgi:hypothetical protein
VAGIGSGEVRNADERLSGGGVVAAEDAQCDYGAGETGRHFGRAQLRLWFMVLRRTLGMSFVLEY